MLLLPSGQVVPFAALRHHDFRLYFTTATASMMADNIEHVITYWLIYIAFHSSVLAGFAVISHWAPFLFFALYIGAIADRYDCRRIIQMSQLLLMVASISWATLYLSGELQSWHAIILLVVHGVAGALYAPAGQLVLHDMVGRDDLPSAVRLNAMARQLGILLGPGVGGGLLLVLGPGYGLLANSLLYLPLTIWISRVPYTGHLRKVEPSTEPSRLSWSDALRTLREASADRDILVLVALVGVTSLLIGSAFQAQMPQFAAGFAEGRSEVAYAALLGSSALGAVVGGVALESFAPLRRPRVRGAIVLGALWSVSLLVFAVTADYVVALGALFVAGVLNLAFSSIAQTIVQLRATAARRGRVVGLFNMSQQGLRVGSGITVGILGGVIGVHESLALSAIVLTVLCVALLVWSNAARPQSQPAVAS